MMVYKQIHVELKIFHGGPKKKIKVFKSLESTMYTFEHFSKYLIHVFNIFNF